LINSSSAQGRYSNAQTKGSN
jgi:hypothetical protein